MKKTKQKQNRRSTNHASCARGPQERIHVLCRSAELLLLLLLLPRRRGGNYTFLCDLADPNPRSQNPTRTAAPHDAPARGDLWTPSREASVSVAAVPVLRGGWCNVSSVESGADLGGGGAPSWTNGPAAWRDGQTGVPLRTTHCMEEIGAAEGLRGFVLLLRDERHP